MLVIHMDTLGSANARTTWQMALQVRMLPKLIAQALALAGTGYQPGDIHECDGRGLYGAP